MANSTARAIVSPHMSFLPYIGLRIAVPLAVYFPLSMSFALVNVAFKLPLGTKFGEGLGFIVSFVFLYLGMAALGLSLEAMITIFTPRFVPFFLFILVRLPHSFPADPCAALTDRLTAAAAGRADHLQRRADAPPARAPEPVLRVRRRVPNMVRPPRP